jgi:hypothetical protein
MTQTRSVSDGETIVPRSCLGHDLCMNQTWTHCCGALWYYLDVLVVQYKWKTERWFVSSRTVKPWHWRKLPWRELNAMKFRGRQLLLLLIFAGTVHRSHGMTLQRVVIDCRMKFWKHGELYVVLSGVRARESLCFAPLWHRRFRYLPSRWRWCWCCLSSRDDAIFQTPIKPPNLAWW